MLPSSYVRNLRLLVLFFQFFYDIVWDSNPHVKSLKIHSLGYLEIRKSKGNNVAYFSEKIWLNIMCYISEVFIDTCIYTGVVKGWEN